jgi:coproporphyrinogen III oxidase-like Fe-S oxidoreductase
MYNKRETEILRRLSVRPEKDEWTRVSYITDDIYEIDNMIKNGLVEVNGKDMKITDFGRKYLKDIEKS